MASLARGLAKWCGCCTVCGMSTLTKAKKTARKPVPVKSVKVKKPAPSWIGSARGKIMIAPGCDLTKPTLPPGKYL